MSNSEDLYLKQYGIDTNIPIYGIFEMNDNEKLSLAKMVLDNLSEWWGLYFSCEQEKIEYDKLEEVRTKLNELILMREEYLTLKRSDK